MGLLGKVGHLGLVAAVFGSVACAPTDDVADESVGQNSDALVIVCGGSYAMTDNAAASISRCTTITGGLTISGSAVSSLRSLRNLRSVSSLTISGTALTNLQGLNILSSPGSLSVRDNPSLVNLTGLGPVTSLNTLDVRNNAALEQLSGLETLTRVQDMYIMDNSAQTSLLGLSGLTYIESQFVLQRCPGVTSLSGLGPIAHVAKLNFIDTPLVSLSGLQLIGAGVEEVWIENTNVTTLTGLEGITSISGGPAELVIRKNNNLTNLRGLHNVSNVSTSFYIMENPALTQCAMPALTSVPRLCITSNRSLPTQLANDLVTQANANQSVNCVSGNL